MLSVIHQALATLLDRITIRLHRSRCVASLSISKCNMRQRASGRSSLEDTREDTYEPKT